ncbi:RagB/SusD family nutrient uptake outer membrane protein [uncultured Hymenobacter sp.]|uniref:RagB/SusD family nutrient uptake outer membrane protein n=1 Tax=uncultured Hymenobacter sp. TaxID=170016 RepID=UPI0035C9A44E
MLKKSTFLFLALLAASCTKDPSDVTQPDKYSSGDYPASLTALSGVLTPAYANLRSYELNGFQMLVKDFACSEHTADLAYGGERSWTELALNNLSVGNSYANDLWKGLYTGVKNANAFLDRADFYEKNGMAPSEQKAVNTLRGEAYFLRALYYYHLECFYGEGYISAAGGEDKMGVPLFSSIPTSLEATQQPRASAKEVWAFIISDLQKSAELLKGVQRTGTDVGRVTEWAAKSLLGKAYVFTQDYASAKPVLLDVIQNSGKALMPYSKYRNAFNAQSSNELNEESLFEINVDRTTPGYGIFVDGANANLTTSQGLIWSPSLLGDDGTENGANNSLGYGNEFMHDRNLLRFGYNLPIYSLVANPNFDASKAASFRNPRRVMDPVTRQKSLDARRDKTVDPRLYVAALQPWVDSVSRDGIQYRPVVKCSGIGAGIKPLFQGWSLKKYVTTDNNIFAYSAADGANYYLLRLADVYLLYAEACQNSGDEANALEYLNKVKRRAYGYPLDQASPVDYQSLTDKTSANDPNLANNPLYYERWAELFAEGHWWFDVGRWRIGAAEAEYYGNTLPTGGRIEWSDQRSYAWPIPTSEVSANAKIVQNPGY